MRTIFSKMVGVLMLPLLMCACSTDLNMTLPEGPAGLSAYEIWAKAVENGEIAWPVDKTEKEDFYLYMQGKNGQDGKSAYDLWKGEVATGNLDDPKNPGQKWPVDKITLADFWNYLTGKNGENGQSAYELWKEAVAEGLPNPHDNQGGNWPANKNTMDDFWEYLRGRDGNDGTTVIIGSPNVLINPIAGVENEYVHPQTGNATYTVYDKSGAKAAAGTQVKNMPATLNNNIYIVDANGRITVPKEDLPLNASINEQWGSCEVMFAGETTWYQSAANTLVPNRIQVRLITVGYRNPVVVNQGFLTVRVQIQRKTSASANWEFTPGTLYNLSGTTIKAYLLTGKDVDPALDITGTSTVLTTWSNANFADQGNSWDMGFTLQTRNVIETGAMWAGPEQYAGVQSFAYGEVLYANAVLDANPPIQKVPMIENVKAQKVGENLYRIAANFEVNNINSDYLYSSGYIWPSSTINSLGIPYLAYQIDPGAANSKCMELKFTKGSGDDQTTIVCNPTSIADAGACKTDIAGGVPVGSTITLSCLNQLMASRGAIGVLDTDGSNGLVIKLNGGGTIPVAIVQSIDI